MYPDERRILMTPGPVVFNMEVLKHMLSTAHEHTSPDFAQIHGEATRKFRRVIGMKGDLPVFFLPGSGTLAFEAAIVNLLKPGSRVLVVSYGFFGDRWVTVSEAVGHSAARLSSPPGERVPLYEVEKELSKGYDAVVVTHVETSTGVKADVEELGKLARKFDTMFFVDGVSSIAAEIMNCSDWGVDVVITASQKALEVPPGIGILALCSEKAFSAMQENDKYVRSFYMRLTEWLKVMKAYEEGKIAYHATPATHLVLALERSLERILKEGMENRYRRHAALARAVREGVRGMGLSVVALEEVAASTITAAYLPAGIDPGELRGAVRARNVVLAMPLHPALRGRSIRIGHMGAVNQNDVIAAIAALERSLRAMGAKVELGSGLRAAQEVLAQEGL